MINTRVWNDTWVSKLDPIEKLLFVYFLTNSYTNISGIYELPLKIAAVETGIDPSMFEKMLPHLEPKVVYKHGWVILPNFPRYQNTENPKIMTGIQRELAGIPKEIHTLSIAYGYPIPLNLTKLNLSEVPLEVVKDEDEEKAPKKDTSAQKEYRELCGWLSQRTGVRFTALGKQFDALARARAAEISKTRLKKRAEELMSDPWHQEHGLDWGMVVNSFDRKP